MNVERFTDLLHDTPPRTGDLFRLDDEEELLLIDDEEQTTATAREAWKILIVDDDEEVHRVTRMVLADLHYDDRPATFVSAFSAGEARGRLREHPDISVVLLDVVMEREDAGLRLVRHIREELENREVRIILRTGQAGRAPERHVILHYDINDYREKTELTAQKLFTSVLSSLRAYQTIRRLERANHDLEAAVAARTAELHATMAELARHRDQLQREQAVAKQLFARVVRPAALDFANLRYRLEPMDVANGDVVLAARRPGGGQYLLLGDFTGHGLTAAIGALPLSQAFRRLTRKGRPLARLVAEINDLLLESLPTGLFLAACAVELLPGGQLRVWNGGVPDALLVDGEGRLRRRIPSTDLPLGVVASNALGLTIQELTECPPDHHLYLYSDGLTEAENAGGEPFGEERLLSCLTEYRPGDGLFDHIHRTHAAFLEDAPAGDDVTLVELRIDPESA